MILRILLWQLQNLKLGDVPSSRKGCLANAHKQVNVTVVGCSWSCSNEPILINASVDIVVSLADKLALLHTYACVGMIPLQSARGTRIHYKLVLDMMYFCDARLCSLGFCSCCMVPRFPLTLSLVNYVYPSISNSVGTQACASLAPCLTSACKNIPTAKRTFAVFTAVLASELVRAGEKHEHKATLGREAPYKRSRRSQPDLRKHCSRIEANSGKHIRAFRRGIASQRGYTGTGMHTRANSCFCRREPTRRSVFAFPCM